MTIHAEIDALLTKTKRGELPRELRIVQIEELTERYFAEHGEMPDEIALERLADLILHEDLFNPSLTKMSDEEYPIMSERQFDRRESKEIPTGKRMDMNASDGQEHGKHTRRKRNDYENLLIDKRARSRNKERKRKYGEFVKVQPVITYDLRNLNN